MAVIRGPSAELTLQPVEALVAGGVQGLEATGSAPDAEKVVSVLVEKWATRACWGWAH